MHGLDVGLAVGLAGLVLAGVGFGLRAGVPAGPTPAPVGHWVLLVEGDARGLAVTTLVAKPDPWGEHAGSADACVVVRDSDGKVLGSYPLDLSHFDLDPAHVGTPTRVDGCAVRETKVCVLCSIPHLAAAAALELRSGERQLGLVDAEHLAKLLTTEVGR